MPPATSTTTAPKAMDEKRWRSTGGHGRSRGPAAATVRCMSPPTHTLAAYWCTASITRRKPSYWSRAAAWLMAAAVTARRMVRPAKVAHPARDSVRRRSHRAATVSATQSRTRSTLDWKYAVCRISPTGQCRSLSRATCWTPRARSCPAATVAAPIEMRTRARPTRPASSGRWRAAGLKTRSAKQTPPMAAAWPQRASPRRMTSRKPATDA